MPRTPARHCGNYKPGHTTHHIPGLRSVNMPWVTAEVKYLGSNIFQLSLADGQTLTLFNHEPGRLLEYLDWFGELDVKYQSDYYLLGIETGNGRAMFNMSKVPLEACFKTTSSGIAEAR
jgi:hypothetical protein